jgi:hypothetical protein
MIRKRIVIPAQAGIPDKKKKFIFSGFRVEPGMTTELDSRLRGNDGSVG